MPRSSPVSRTVGSGQAQNCLETSSRLAQVFTHVPESKQRRTETKTPAEIQRLKQPFQGRAEVVDLRIALRQPPSSLVGTKLGISFLGENKTVGRMGTPDRRLFATFDE